MSQTIGQQLKQAREERRLTIEKIVEATHIRAHHIEAIEADDFESLPSPVQARAFLRLYAEYLGLSLDDLIARQRETATQETATQADLEPAPVDPIILPPEPPAPEPPSPLLQTLTRLKDKLIPPQPAGEEPAADTERGEQVDEEPEAENFPEPETPDLPVEETTVTPAEPARSQVIFAAIGETLRQRRESLSLTLEEIERHTHVRRHYLQALEAGEFDQLPSSVQARGMLNNYARFLDMDVDAVLLQFADGLQAQLIERQPKPVETPQPVGKFPFKVNIPPSLRRLLNMDILVGGGLVILLVIFAFWGTSQIIRLNSATTPQPTAPSISDILASNPGETIATPSATVEGSAVVIPQAGETAVVTIPAGGTGAVQVVVVASERAWVRVVVDGKIEFEGRVETGAAYAYDGDTQIEVLTGDGSAIRILYNQSDLGPMGNFGEVVDRIYTANAILNPTPTNTPTPTITLTPTRTPRPSATPRPSSTPRFSPTPTE